MCTEETHQKIEWKKISVCVVCGSTTTAIIIIVIIVIKHSKREEKLHPNEQLVSVCVCVCVFDDGPANLSHCSPIVTWPNTQIFNNNIIAHIRRKNTKKKRSTKVHFMYCIHKIKGLKVHFFFFIFILKPFANKKENEFL